MIVQASVGEQTYRKFIDTFAFGQARLVTAGAGYLILERELSRTLR
jgi:hypothetical protein